MHFLGKTLLVFALFHSVLQGKPFNITVIQVYTPTTNAEEAEFERFYDELQDLLELTPKKDVLFIIEDWNSSKRQIWPWNRE